jgi:predicted metalloenzyme YecM
MREMAEFWRTLFHAVSQLFSCVCVCGVNWMIIFIFWVKSYLSFKIVCIEHKAETKWKAWIMISLVKCSIGAVTTHSFPKVQESITPWHSVFQATFVTRINQTAITSPNTALTLLKMKQEGERLLWPVVKVVTWQKINQLASVGESS